MGRFFLCPIVPYNPAVRFAAAFLIPFRLGSAIYGLVYGMTARQAGIPLWVTFGMSLIAPVVFLPDGELALNPMHNSCLLSAAATALAAYFTKKSLPAILTGVGTAFPLSLL